MSYSSSLVHQKFLVLTLCVLLPGSLAFLAAKHRVDSSILPPESLYIDGLRIRQATIDMGMVWSGGQGIRREFEIENHTGHGIHIDSAQSDCGCTMPLVVSAQARDGESAKISLVFWPPSAANDHGGRFRRTISVVVSTANGQQTIPLSLIGYLAPDESLRVSPASIDITQPTATNALATVLHFKGSARVIASIPDTLTVHAGSHQRVYVQTPLAGLSDAITTKDVRVYVSGDEGSSADATPDSTITFAPDEDSDGLTEHIRFHSVPFLFATPRSLILADDSDKQEVVIQINSRVCALNPVVHTILPLICDISPQSKSRNIWSLRVLAKGQLAADMTGSIAVQFDCNSAAASNQTGRILIPVVILHRPTTGIKQIAPETRDLRKGE